MKEWFKARYIWGAAIQMLSDEEAGRLTKALWNYTMTGQQTDLHGAEKGIFAMIQMTLKQDEKHDQEVSMKRSRATESIRRRRSTDTYHNELISNDCVKNQLISIDCELFTKVPLNARYRLKHPGNSHTSQPENKQQAAIILSSCHADHARDGSGF